MRTRLSGHRWLVLTIATMLLALAGAAITQAASPPGTVQRVNVAYDGGLANNEGILGLACSSDGRYVAFATSASNIIAGDTNARYDIFWRDTKDQVTKLVSVSLEGTFTPNGTVNYCDMTTDGRYVVFYSNDSSLVASDINGRYDAFRRDMFSGETVLVSTASNGEPGDWDSGDPSISDDGRYIAMYTSASNLFPGDSNGLQDCVVKDLVSGETTHVSYGVAGVPGNGHSFYPTISGNGRKVAFVSYATNLVPDDGNSQGSIFVRDLDTGELERVDAKPDGGESATEVDLNYCDVDFSGRFIAFSSRQKDLVSTSVGIFPQVFRRDTVSDETTVVTRGLNGGVPNNNNALPKISSDGRYVSFASQSSDLVPSDVNATWDIFMRDMESTTTEMLTLNEFGEQLDMHTLEHALSASATAVAFNTIAHNILPPYSGVQSHIYLRLFRLDDSRPPTVTADAVASYVSTASISIEATDGLAGAGVESITWKLDDEPTQTVTKASVVVTAGPGSHELQFSARDLAGNESEAHEVTFTVLAVPAVEITSSDKALTKWGGAYNVTGVLRTGAAPLAGRLVRLQSSATSTGFADTSLTATTSADGTFTIKVTPQSKTYYRVVFEGDAAAISAVSATWVRVLPVAWVGTPHAPSKASRSKSVSVYGYLKPRHTSGTYPVRIYRWKKTRSGSWKRYGDPVKAKARIYKSFTKYSCSVRLSSAGKWRLRASAPADSGHALSWSSGYDYVTVK